MELVPTLPAADSGTKTTAKHSRTKQGRALHACNQHTTAELVAVPYVLLLLLLDLHNLHGVLGGA